MIVIASLAKQSSVFFKKRFLWIALSLVLLAMTASACTPQQQLFNPEKNESTLGKTTFTTADNVAFPYRSWLPKAKPKAVLIALHGMNDYSHAFVATGDYMKAQGIAVYAYDQRGFGAAANPGIWGNNENLKQDLKQFVVLIAKHHPRTPLYILGESMGGAVAIAALANVDFPAIKGVVLSAPAVWGGDSMNPIMRGMLWAMAHTVPSRTMTGRDLKIKASDNIPMLIALGRDPLVIKATRTDAVYGMVSLMDAAYENIPSLDTNILLLYGGNDQVIPQDPIEIALARFKRPITFVFYPKAYHMLLRDLDNERVLGDIASWIGDNKKPLPSGFSRIINPQ